MAHRTLITIQVCLTVFIVSFVFSTDGNSNFSSPQPYIAKAAERLLEIQQLKDNKDDIIRSQFDLIRALSGGFRPISFISDFADQGQMVITEGFELTPNSSYEISTTCLNHTQLLLEGLANGKQWALKMIDAIGKPPSDILGLHVAWLGSYDECVAAKAELLEDPQSHPYTGRYCKASFPVASQRISILSQGLALTVGLCVPNSCSNEDVTALVNTGIYALPINTSFVPSPFVSCQLESLDFDTKAVATIVVCSVFGLMMLLATAYDVLIKYNVIPVMTSKRKYGLLIDIEDQEEVSVPDTCTTTVSEKTPLTPQNGYHKQYTANSIASKDEPKPQSKYQPGTLENVLLSFSIYTNASKLLSTTQPAGALSAVNGIRFLSMSWVILGHTYVFGLPFVDNIAEFYPKMMERFTFQAVSNATFSVDSFFVLSGLLVAFLALKQMKKVDGAARFGWGMYYFHRFWRLTPPYMLFLMFYVSLIKYWSNGPLWSQSGVDLNECRDSWWRNLLYINNLYNDGKMCMAWSWYLANDMQFFILSPLLLVPLYYSSLIGGIVCLVFLLICAISNGVISATNDYPANMMANTNPTFETNVYFKPYTRIGPYVIGIMAGYLLYKTECKLRISKVLNLLCWTVAACIALSVLYGLYDVNGDNMINNLTTEVSALYNALGRTAWGVALAWVIVACATENGGFVNTLLSWKPFIPLGRLTYCAYLVHPVVLYVYYMSRSTLVHFYDLEMIYLFLVTMCVSYGVAFCISLAFESPMMGLEKALLGRGKNS